MSVVACRITEGGYEIASDSITVRGYTQTRESNTARSKLFEVNGLVVGSVGLAEEASLFRVFATTHRPAAASEESVLDFLVEFSDWKRKRTDVGDIENAYILGLQDSAFLIEAWLVDRITTYEAIGAGMDYALAALYLGFDAQKAVETAIELSIFCESPVQVISRPTPA